MHALSEKENACLHKRNSAGGPAVNREAKDERGLAAEQLLLLVDIFLRNVAGGDQRIDASLGHVAGILLEAHVEKRAAKPILVAELVVFVGAGILHRLGNSDRLSARRAGKAKRQTQTR